MHRILYLAFALSGGAGLIYEAVWGRYLALFVGHSAYAQVLVIGTYLGGMAVGALLVGGRARRIRRPLVWYAWAEAGLAGAGLLFHPLFLGITRLAYDGLIPALGNPAAITAGKWGLAIGILLPQAILLGTTFPLMSSGFIRAFPKAPGRTLALLYFTNSLGAAVGVLVGGFLLVRTFGFPGSLASAAALNLMAAFLAFYVARTVGQEGQDPSPGVEEMPFALGEGMQGTPLERRLLSFLLAVSFFTAVASFAYEIGWIRMLSLVMGSATHSFEVMLSAFILGLALGSLFVRRRADAGLASLTPLGWIQWVMGFTALATLPVYASTFESMAYLVETLPPTDTGYALFGVARYGIAIAIMLPSTIMAGMTLPLITATLLHAGVGEGAIGWVYGVNTLGSVLGVALAGLLGLPLLGLKGLILAGALLDMGLGVLILALRVRLGGGPGWKWASSVALLGALMAGGLIHTGLSMDRRLLISGVFRYGTIPEEGAPVLFYKDGRTATVGVHVAESRDLAVLTTNGKPDASISLRWIRAQGELLRPMPIVFDDEATQTLLALIPMAYHPHARSSAQIGHGSGLTGQAILASPHLESSVTIEIEPEIITASEAFYPANARVYDDPRSTFVINDAKAYFASQQETFDIIISEPSNPWVSGVSSLFTVEFYKRVSQYLAPGGVFAQWFQCYEMNDDLVATVLASLHTTFPHFQAYQVGPGDILMVASRDRPLPPPDWTIFQYPAVSRMLAHVHPFTPGHLEAMHLFDGESLGSFLEGWEPKNSDFFPHLDLGAERARYKKETASGFLNLGGRRVLIPAFLEGRRRGFSDSPQEPVLGVVALQGRSIGHWLREVMEQRPLPESAPTSEHQQALDLYRDYSHVLRSGRPPEDWRRFMMLVAGAERIIHRGTAGVADTLFYGRLFTFLEDQGAPDEAHAAARFLHGLASWDQEETLAALPLLLEATSRRQEWVPLSLLRDWGVLALFASGDRAGALRLLEEFAPDPDRSFGSGLDIPFEMLRTLVAGGSITGRGEVN